MALTSIGEHAATVAMRAICSCRLYLEVQMLPLAPHAGLCRSLVDREVRSCWLGLGIGDVLCSGPGCSPLCMSC